MTKRIGIIGAGTAGQQLGIELRRKPGLRACVIAFFDENRSLWESYVSGIPVIGPPDKLLDPVLRWNLKLDEVLLALDDPAARTVLPLMHILRKAGLPARILSEDFELIRKAEAAHLRAVELGDVFPDARWVAREEEARRVIESRVILVAGAGLPVGKEICRRILRRYPRRLVVLESSVDELAGLERELADLGQGGIVVSGVWCQADAREANILVKELRPDGIFYLPDQRVRYGDRFAAEYFERNVLPLVHFADAA